ncbi:MAG: glycosyltransferase, partial [Chitinophagales bacterium]|nr:glycosyltransferase [Chitinophagales bacterium]
MQKVLLLTYYWPPAGGVAVQRWLKFCKYLPEHGWIPHVITVKDGSYPYIDTSLEREVPPEVNLYRTHALEPFAIYNFFRGNEGKQLPTAFLDSSARKTFFQKVAEWVRANFFIPDARLGWIPFAQRAAASIIRSENIKVVITTGPPHSTHLAGLWLKKRFEIKWVADFRDPWTNIFTNQYLPRSAYAQRKDERLESMVLSKADIITVIGPSMKKEFEGKAKKVEVIWNGYDD